ncbi:hypothetical protein EJ02DRAFT_240476 [Clathrospora elynae]|uniref:Fungal N-terminal domain-containing protein n=1 Tax=Clathrospora elynae TaxID=706981 RepID=A0A6A5SHF5_9PLEO|nr:hypothetical protein EJ02DRAFT_240476 [Clathrospora elynae]
MGDPLSLAAGVGGLLSLTIQLLQIANKFKDDLEGFSEEIGFLVEELNALKSVLELLKKAWENRRVPANFDLSALARIEATCEAQLEDLFKKLRKDEVRLQKKPYASIHSAMARIKWPLAADKTREITKLIHRYFCIFSWSLSCSDSNILYGISEDVCRALRDQEETLHKVRDTVKSFEDLRQHIDTGIYITSSVQKSLTVSART